MPDAAVNPAIRLLDGAFYAEDPHRHFEWMRQHAPVYYDETSGLWGVALHGDVMAVSKDSQTFCSGQSSRPDAPAIPSMINLDSPEHMRRRNLVNRGFTPRRIADHEARVREICTRIIDEIAPRGRCDFVADVAAPLPMIVIGDLLGVDPADHDRLLRWSDDLILGTSSTATAAATAAAARAFGEYAEYHRHVVADRRSNPPADDLMSVLVHAEIDGEKLDDEALLQESLLILIGGDETTRHVISGGMEQLIRNPSERQKLVDDPGRIPTAVEEMLRFATPIQNMNRTATRDVELSGQRIARGDKVLLLYASANRDERVFHAPHRFDALRTPNPHVAFGGYGAHFCLGSSLARLELRVMFEELLRRLPDMQIATDEPLPRRPSNFIVGIEHMPVEFTPVAVV